MLRRGEAVVCSTQRRRQDHGVLYDHRAREARQRHYLARRLRRDAAADVSAGAAWRRLSAAEASVFRGLSVEDNIRAVLEITQPDKRKRAEELEACSRNSS